MLSAELRLLSVAWCPNCPSPSFVRYGAVVVLGEDAAVLGCIGMLAPSPEMGDGLDVRRKFFMQRVVKP